MKTIVIKSNHGNHTGFNRLWEVLNCGWGFDSEEDAKEYLGKVADEVDEQYDGETDSFMHHGPIHSFEYDLCYYYVVTQDDYQNGWFDGGHHGCANLFIKHIFEQPELFVRS